MKRPAKPSKQLVGTVLLAPLELLQDRRLLSRPQRVKGLDMNAIVRAIVAGLFFLFIFLSGIWLSRSGRPLKVGISTVHKLISLAAGIFLLVTIYQRSQVVALSAIEWIAIVVTGLCFLGTVASGGFLSSDRPMPDAVLRVHQIMPILTVLSTAATLYLLLGR